MNVRDYVISWVGFTRQTDDTFALVQQEKWEEMQILDGKLCQNGGVSKHYN